MASPTRSHEYKFRPQWNKKHTLCRSLYPKMKRLTTSYTTSAGSTRLQPYFHVMYEELWPLVGPELKWLRILEYMEAQRCSVKNPMVLINPLPNHGFLDLARPQSEQVKCWRWRQLTRRCTATKKMLHMVANETWNTINSTWPNFQQMGKEVQISQSSSNCFVRFQENPCYITQKPWWPIPSL